MYVVADYEQWDCQKCQATSGYSYCLWKDSFNADGGCLPNVADAKHIPCGDEEGDVVVETCEGWFKS